MYKLGESLIFPHLSMSFAWILPLSLLCSFFSILPYFLLLLFLPNFMNYIFSTTTLLGRGITWKMYIHAFCCSKQKEIFFFYIFFLCRYMITFFYEGWQVHTSLSITSFRKISRRRAELQSTYRQNYQPLLRWSASNPIYGYDNIYHIFPLFKVGGQMIWWQNSVKNT